MINPVEENSLRRFSEERSRPGSVLRGRAANEGVPA